MDDRKLKEYALKIFNNVPGYSLQKAFSLFPMYYTKIAFYYSELITQKQEELTTKTIQSLGLSRAQTLVKLARATNTTMWKYYASSIATMKSLDAYENSFDSYEEFTDYTLNVFFEKHNKIIDNVAALANINNKALYKIKAEANKYGFGDILKEAEYYLALNKELLINIKDASNYYVENYMKRLNIN